jgi:alginate O-acetyltransferase complex protein AlgI
VLFPTYSFLLLFLPAVLVLRWGLVRPPALRSWVLPVAGVAFYCGRGPRELGLLLALTVLTFVAVGLLARSDSPASRRAGLGLLWVDLLVLFAFKLENAAGVGMGGAALPLGISFYTFNLLSYGLDANARTIVPAPSFASLASYATFFPTVTAGPLLRFGSFEKQRAADPRVDWALIEVGAVSLVVGLAKKRLVADPLGAAVEPLFAAYERLGLFDSWLAILGYAYQLYFDFSGYSDMAIGIAALLGFRIPQNFDAPYTAAHIADFWQRWHMTMSRWFRDYLFLPMSRSLLRRNSSLDGAGRVRTLCLLVTMVAIGLWHGATWAFLAWGLYHGLLLAGHAQLRSMRGLSVPAGVARMSTFVAVLVGWVLLRSPSPGMALRVWGGMMGLHGTGASLTGPRLDLSLAVLILFVATNLRFEMRLLEPRRTPARSWTLAALLVLSLLSLGHPSPFLYFQF